MGRAGLVLGTVLSFAFGKSRGRIVAVALFGAGAVVGLFAVGYFSASPDEDCHECTEVLGRWMSPIFAFGFLPANLITWMIGTFIGAFARRSRRTGLASPG